jgi:hypothetical protein
MRLLLIPVRSLMPCLTILVIAGTLVWGPWVTLGLALVIHTIIGRTQ